MLNQLFLLNYILVFFLLMEIDIMGEWKEVEIGSLCLSVSSGGTPKSTNESYYGGIFHG